MAGSQIPYGLSLNEAVLFNSMPNEFTSHDIYEVGKHIEMRQSSIFVKLISWNKKGLVKATGNSYIKLVPSVDISEYDAVYGSIGNTVKKGAKE